MTAVQLAVGVVNAKLMTDSRALKQRVSEIVSYSVAGAEHMTAFKMTGWNGRSSMFTFRDGRFPAGLAPLVRDTLSQEGHKVQILRAHAPAPLGPENPKVDSFPEDPRYDYQMETVRRLLKHRSMIARVATGGGKSRIAKLAVARIKRPTLFLTTRGLLMYQMKAGFEECGFNVGVLGDGEWNPCRGVNVGMVQTLVARLEEYDAATELEKIQERERKADAKARKDGIERVGLTSEQMIAEANRRVREQAIVRKKTVALLSYFEFVIGEEAHEASGQSYYEILRHCKNAVYRLALTATPFMKEDEESNMRLQAAFGPIGIEISEKLLIDRGILAKPYFKFVTIACPPKLKRTSSWLRAYDLGIENNPFRNAHIRNEARKAKAFGLSVMILVRKKEHGRNLERDLNAHGVRTDFIFGEHDQKRRQRALNRLKRGEIDCLIGSTILDVGVDVPAVGMVILAAGGKAEVSHRQRIGRGLREKKVGPNVCFVVDFNDPWNLHLQGHALTRRKYVEGTPGFVENVLPDGADFPYEKVGLSRKA